MIAFEWTISLGNVVAIICIIAPVLSFYFYNIRLASRLESKLDIVVRLVEFDRRLMDASALEAIRVALKEHDAREREIIMKSGAKQ